MSLIDDLNSHPGLYAICPNSSCGEKFRLSEASLFDATKPLPAPATQKLAQRKADLAERRADLRRRRHLAITKPAIGAESGGIGKVAEKIALSLPGFPVDPADCRALFEPIDYVVFRGLTKQGIIDSLLFVDVKTGNGKLEKHQCQIRDLVQRGKVSLDIIRRAEEGI